MAGVLGSVERWVSAGTVSSVAAQQVWWRQDGPDAGRPITLIHGFPTSSHDWAAILPRLTSAGLRVTLLDLHGFGASAKPRGHRYLLTDQATLVEALWRHLGIDRTALVAHDYGSSVAQELLARSPERFTSVTFLNGGVYPDLHRPIAVQRLLHGRLGPLIARFSSERTFAAAMRSITSRPIADADLHAMWESVSSDGGTRVQHDLLHYIDERKEHRERWVGAMEAYAGPRQFIWGPDDPISGAHVLERIRDRMPTSRIDELPRVGHYPQIEDPDAVATALLEFVQP